MVVFPVEVERDDDGSLFITCPLLPEVTTFSGSEADWHKHALDALEEAIAARMTAWEMVPIPESRDLNAGTEGNSTRAVKLSLQTVMKLMLFWACKQANVSRAELARRLAWHREQVDRLFRLDHASRIDQIDSAMCALGKTFDIGLSEAA